MKKIALLLFTSLLVLLSSCRAKYPVSQASGQDDVAYLLFVSSSNNSNSEVDVTIDDNISFKATTVKERKSNYKGTAYTVSTGKKSIKVSQNGNVLYSKMIFLSPQETKKIMLP